MNAAIFYRLCPALLASLWLSNAHADTVLWYNGDYAGGSGTVNENSSNVGVANIYEDFNVTAPGGWTVQRLWSNDCMSYSGVTSAAWSIRSGLSAGFGGTIIASGTASATQTPTGRSAWWGGYPEYTIQITGLNVYLAPGTYWLSVSPLVGSDPLSNGQYRSYISQTWGLNAVGAPAGNNGNSFMYDPPAGYYFAPDTFNEDYSMGVAGTVVPEPSTLAFSAAGAMLLLGSQKKCR